MYLQLKLSDYTDAADAPVRWRLRHCDWLSRWHYERRGEDAYQTLKLCTGTLTLELDVAGVIFPAAQEHINMCSHDTLEVKVEIRD
jgi:hypothetical protein